jgi:radical SAM superfamily enzyme YgiQ (UPF0313 family)
MSAKVLVLNPPAEKARFSRDGRCQSKENAWLDTFPPTGIASIAGAVRERYETKVLDCIGARVGFDECIKQAVEFNPDFTVVNTATPTIASDMQAAKAIKERTGSKIIAFGPHITACYKKMLKEFPQLDFAVLGEPETPVLGILAGKQKAKGVATRKFDGGTWQEPNLDALPFPAYDLLPTYTYPLTGEKWAFVRSGRGCPFNCSYCVMPRMCNRSLRYHSPGYMIRQMKWLVNGLGIRLLMLWDELATFDKKRMLNLCEKIVKEGLHKKCRWFCTTRVDCFDRELAENMRKAGCEMISFGIESGSQAVLDRNKKGITIEQALNAVKAAKSSGLKTIGHFIIGLPGSSPKTELASILLAKKLKLNFAQFYIATPFPGSEFYKQAVENKWLASVGWSHIEQGSVAISYPSFSAEEIEKWKNKAYASFYLRPYTVYSLLSSMSVKKLFWLPKYVLAFFS